jgi:ubiquitin-large subunit ribosomal protein L40e
VGVKLLSGKTFSVMIGPTDTVAALKQRIFEREGIPPQRQNLLVMGKQLQPDTRSLHEYNLKPGDMIYVTAG